MLVDLTDSRTYLQIDYEADSADPARIFRSMAGMLDAFQELDRNLVHAVSASLEPVIILERIEAGSLRARLRTLVKALDDDALKNLDWKPLIGQYLVTAKHKVLKWLDQHDHIEDRSAIQELQSELIQIQPVWSRDILLASPIPQSRLLENLRSIADARHELLPQDTMIFVGDGATTIIETDLRLSSEEIERLLTQEVVSSDSRIILLVKKPDYLGNSRWEFRFGDRVIEARVLDGEWLDRFRKGQVTLQPGDALDAVVRAEVYRGFEGSLVTTKYSVLRVFRVVQNLATNQPELKLSD